MGQLPVELQNIVTENRTVLLPHPDFEEIINTFLTSGFSSERDAEIAEIIEYAIAKWSMVEQAPAVLTHQDILAELDFIFGLLRYGYAAYNYQCDNNNFA